MSTCRKQATCLVTKQEATIRLRKKSISMPCRHRTGLRYNPGCSSGVVRQPDKAPAVRPSQWSGIHNAASIAMLRRHGTGQPTGLSQLPQPGSPPATTFEPFATDADGPKFAGIPQPDLMRPVPSISICLQPCLISVLIYIGISRYVNESFRDLFRLLQHAHPQSLVATLPDQRVVQSATRSSQFYEHAHSSLPEYSVAHASCVP